MTFSSFTLFTSSNIVTYDNSIDKTSLFTVADFDVFDYLLTTDPTICDTHLNYPELIEKVGLSGSVTAYYLGDSALPLDYGFTGVNYYCTAVVIST